MAIVTKFVHVRVPRQTSAVEGLDTLNDALAAGFREAGNGGEVVYDGDEELCVLYELQKNDASLPSGSVKYQTVSFPSGTGLDELATILANDFEVNTKPQLKTEGSFSVSMFRMTKN